MQPIRVLFKRLHPKAVLPKRATAGAACYDLAAVEAATVPPSMIHANGQVEVGKAIISTGWAMAIPPGFVGRIGSRSGLAFNQHIEVGGGWVDGDYTGEVKVKLINLSSYAFTIHPGDRIAQLALLQIATPTPEEVEELPKTARGRDGFGSTGLQ